MAVTAQVLQGGFSDPARQSSVAFRAAMIAMARPGEIKAIKGAEAPGPISQSAATLLLTLCDRETPLHLAGAHDDAALRDWINFHIGAPLVPAAEAMFVLGFWDALAFDVLQIGTAEYPDRSATVIVEMEGLANQGARLTGPGIKESNALSLPDLAVFQNNHALFPLGLDFYFCAGDQLAALPRSTKVEG